VTIDGRLDADGVDELHRVVAWLTGPIRLDLAGLRSADEAGLAALRALRARHIALTRASPYLRLLLRTTGRGKAREPPSRPQARRGARGARRSLRKGTS
jgi:hypothetical protein